MKINSNIRQVVESLNRKIENKTRKCLDAVCDDITKTTQRNFDKEVPYIPADDPYVSVSQTPTFYMGKSAIGRKIECVGNQVLFIEFGAGFHESSKTNTIDKPTGIEFASRPFGIYPIGHYKSTTSSTTNKEWQVERISHESRGKDDYWFYSSDTGRGSYNAEQIRYNDRVGTYTMLTIGIRPVRALYRAIGTSFKKLGNGRLKTND